MKSILAYEVFISFSVVANGLLLDTGDWAQSNLKSLYVNFWWNTSCWFALPKPWKDVWGLFTLIRSIIYVLYAPWFLYCAVADPESSSPCPSPSSSALYIGSEYGPKEDLGNTPFGFGKYNIPPTISSVNPPKSGLSSQNT